MVASVRQLNLILELFFPPELAIPQAVYVLGVIISLYPPISTSSESDERGATDEADNAAAWATGVNLGSEYAEYICADLDTLYVTMGLHNATQSDLDSLMFRRPRPILATRRVNCRFCPVGDRNLVPSLRRRKKKGNQPIWLLDATFQWVSADLLVAYCARCHAEYYPDVITQKGAGRYRIQLLEYDAEYLRVSKSGVWVHRKIALAQEKALHRFHSGWSNFADWINDTTDDINVKFTYPQSQKLFIQHFSRRLLVAHGKANGFTCEAHPTSKTLARAVREVIGENGGVLLNALSHGCIDCTHVKRYKSDLVREGAVFGGDTDVAGSEPGLVDEADTTGAEEALPLPPNLPEVLPQQQQPPDGSPRGYVRMAVMDGKTLRHRKCALDECRNPLVNYKNGRFCETHLDHRDICGIIPCGQTVHTPGALTCDDQSHIDWHKQYQARFQRLSFPGVQRVMRHQNEEQAGGPTLEVKLPALAPPNGTQPDLILTVEDDNGVSHQTRAFNTETAEQFNSWLNGFESQLQQMTDVNYDFYIHVLMLVYGEMVEKKIRSKERRLTEVFWDQVNGVIAYNVDL
ncbi:hypothetical protein MVEN_00133600 [Mycena venus]|uniref:CxC5 like cysteine cluster associated with KDZ domain-containing protein n=1 Tax=Mycena venus TaxID=2733690 RepID=A0A8H7DGW4_9AGAR|nr:hypothetical protein MVEN_00133600 [Mycena venus]